MPRPRRLSEYVRVDRALQLAGIAAIVLLAILTAYAALDYRDSAPENASAKTPRKRPATTQPAATGTTTAPATTGTTTAPTTTGTTTTGPATTATTTTPTATATTPTGTATTGTTTTATPAAGSFRLVLTAARGDSWVEVRRGSVDGAALYAGLLTEGQTKAVRGSGTLWVGMGASYQLDATLNGKRVTLPDASAVLVTPKGVRSA